MGFVRSLSRLVVVLVSLVVVLMSGTAAWSQTYQGVSWSSGSPTIPSDRPLIDLQAIRSLLSGPLPSSTGTEDGIPSPISHLEVGLHYDFGNKTRTKRLTADYVLPFSPTPNHVAFGEAHYETYGFPRNIPGADGSRTDLSLGGGYRMVINNVVLFGVNGFHDSTKLHDTWYSGGGVGCELVTMVGSLGEVDLNLNYYGNMFDNDLMENAFRNKGGSFDVQVGCSQLLTHRCRVFKQPMDIRVAVTGYKFDIGTPVYGLRFGAELKTGDGFFVLRYAHGEDEVNGEYHSIGGTLTMGFRLENVLKGESPIELPEPIFYSSRNLKWMLSHKVRRSWYQPTAVVVSSTTP
jgi:hypothetical protein